MFDPALSAGFAEGMPPGMPPGGMVPPPGPLPQDAAPAPADGPGILKQMLDLADEYRQQEEDEVDLLAIEKVRTLVQQLLANNQKMSDDLMQGKASPAALRKAPV